MARGARKPKTGTPIGGLSESPERKKRRAKARKRQEQRWAAKASPVKIYFQDPETRQEGEQPPI
jgi:hypothetical protein